MNTLEQKIKEKTARAAVIGLGYVGLPLALTIQKAGFLVWGIDKDKSKIAKIKLRQSYIDDITDGQIAEAIKSKHFIPTADFNALKQADVVIIAVPTPLNKYKTPDLSYIESAVQETAKRLRKGMLVVLESTTYPGTTEEVALPLLQKNNPTLTAGRDFFLAFSPERVDPGNKQFTITNTPKVVGGVDERSTKLAVAFYEKIIERVIPVSSARAAEMTKLLENIFRIVNISLVNELALLSNKMDIDIWEVIGAASTKPYGFMPFYPGPGVGGHCIKIDPFYLSYKAREYGFFTRFIDLAGEINELMPSHVVTKVATALNYSAKKSINGSRILLVGVSYKKNIKDTRESAAYPIAEALHKKGARLAYYDPYIEKFIIPGAGSIKKISALAKSAIARYDAVVIITDHKDVDYERVARFSRAVIDTRNAIKKRGLPHVYRI